MTKGTFNKVGQSDKILFGPRAILACGFGPEEQQLLNGFLEIIEIRNLPVIFATDMDGDTRLRDLFAQPDQTGQGLDSGLERAIILSGVAEKELHRTLSAYRDTGLPRPLWATLTPISQEWPLSALIAELKKERAAMEKRNK